MANMEAKKGCSRMRSMEDVTSLSKKRRTNIDSELSNLPEASSLSDSTSPVNSKFTSHEVSSDHIVNNNLKSTDLKAGDSENEISTAATVEFRETSQSSELFGGDSAEVMESSSTAKKKSSPKYTNQKCPAKEMPSEDEIEMFFSEAEKSLQKGFAEKYNYDIVKDIPLEGRYEWIPLNP